MIENVFASLTNRSEYINMELTLDEFRILEKTTEDTGYDRNNIIGKALIVYDRLREFVCK